VARQTGFLTPGQTPRPGAMFRARRGVVYGQPVHHKARWVAAFERRGKADIMNYFGDRKSLGLDITYLVTEVPYGAPYKIDRAYEFVKDDIVALAFPIILFDADAAFSALVHRPSLTGADVVVGLFPADRPDKCDMVAVDEARAVKQIVIKQKDCVLAETWGIAVWAPRFSTYLRDYLKTRLSSAATA